MAKTWGIPNPRLGFGAKLECRGGMNTLNAKQRLIHGRALMVSSEYRKSEHELLRILLDVDRTQLFHRLDCPSLFKYAVHILGLSESIAYALITVARKSKTVPALLDSGLSVAKASRIVSIITPENCAELIDFAHGASVREIDREVARRNPRAAARDKTTYLAEDLAEIKFAVGNSFLVKCQRAQALEAQRGAKDLGFCKVLEAALDVYLEHRDPVLKAERAEKKRASRATQAQTPQTGSELCTYTVPLTAAQRHAVFARDNGRCTEMIGDGIRCNSDRWVEVHHLKKVSEGGTNDPENLTILCSHHHRLRHS